ncbi:hypothetical protein DFH06DRAFT_524536 [Mycena polygramma]|nr:hypothetical protein DFH06DRAFT_524536 [Mycena polygramma]
MERSTSGTETKPPVCVEATRRSLRCHCIHSISHLSSSSFSSASTMKFMMLLMAAAGCLAAAVTDSRENQPSKTVSITSRPAPPPINGPANVSASGPSRTLSADFTITSQNCIVPHGLPAQLEDCADLCAMFEDEPDVGFSIAPQWIEQWTRGTCVFEILNRDTCGTLEGTWGQIWSFCGGMVADCAVNGEDGIIVMEDPPVLMVLASNTDYEDLPPYTADSNCNDAHDEI